MPVIRFRFWPMRALDRAARAARVVLRGCPATAPRRCANLSHGEHRQLEIAMGAGDAAAHASCSRADGGMDLTSQPHGRHAQGLKSTLTILLISNDMERCSPRDQITCLGLWTRDRIRCTGGDRANAEVRQGLSGSPDEASGRAGGAG